jgi:D-amino-acid dehydrogenase
VTNPDVLVIGGGIVGWAAAYTAIRAGASVTIIDRHDDGQATAAGAGIVSPGTSFRLTDEMLELSRSAVEFYPQLLEDLAEDGETNTGFASPGVLFLFRDETEMVRRPEMEQFALTRSQAGVRYIGEITSISGSEARKLFPPLGEVAGALHLTGASRLDGRLMRDSIKAAAIRRGAVFIDGSAAVVRNGDRVSLVTADKFSATPGSVIIAGGAWSPDLAQSLGVSLAIYPQRGQILHFDLPGETTTDWPILHGLSNHYMLTFPTSRVVAGATREDDAGFAYHPTAVGVHSQLTEALAVAPGLGSAKLYEVRIGFRPASRDGKPFIGTLPGIENAFLASGHGPSGLQLGPVSGAAVANLVLGNAPGIAMEPFNPARPIALQVP